MLMSRSRAKSTWTRTCVRGRVVVGSDAALEGCAQIVERWARLLPQPVAAGAACGVRLADRRAQVLLELEDAHLVHLDDAERLRVEPRRQRDPEARHVPQLAVRAPAAAAEGPAGVALTEVKEGVGPKNAVQNRFFLKEGRIEATVEQYGSQFAIFGIEFALEMIAGNAQMTDRTTAVKLVTPADLDQ